MIRKSDTRAQGNNPRFPRKPSATMLNDRLNGTRVLRCLTATHTASFSRGPAPGLAPQRPQPSGSSRTTVRLARGAPLLNCEEP